MRRSLPWLLAAALLIAAYAAAGFWAFPRWLGDRLVETAAATGHELKIGAIRVNPFTLVLEADRVRLARGDAPPLLELGQLRADFELWSLLRRAWRFED